jgi:alkylation response protein AidB-like acyl-CoA dehydrogenase
MPASPADTLRRILPEIEGRAEEADIAGRFPAEDVKSLAQIGLLKAFSVEGPARLDGADGFVDSLFACLRLLGGANLSLGRIFEGHVNAIGLIEAYGDGKRRDRLRADLESGSVFGVWNTEPAPGVSLNPAPAGWALTGAKSYATGAGYLDRAIVTARLPDGRKQMLVLPVGEHPDRAAPSRWRTSGMRGTVSGFYDVSGMTVQPDLFLGEPGDYEREPMFTSGAWRFTAVQFGAIETLARLFRTHLRMTGGDGDPIQRARFGRVVAAARTAFQWTREAARRAENTPGPNATAFVLMTRGVVEEAALSVMEAVERGVGTRAFFTGNPIDRVMRDLRLYLRQPAPDRALDQAAKSWLEADCWSDDPWW